ncbi:hypothetical protein DFH09DRAFT_374938 [Mycena vulgaris]|nr:hypothetical protein DFH09DRAFT_374938 [Mycena vulgaris]
MPDASNRVKLAAVPASPSFLGLSRELRDAIYVAAVEPQVLFTHIRKQQAERYKGICLPLPNPSPLEQSHEKVWPDEDIVLFEDGEGLGGSPTLAYKLLWTFTPLLLVSRQVYEEAKDLPRKIEARMHNLVRQSIQGDVFVQPPQSMFLDLCARSRFELGTEAAGSMSFLRRIADPVRPHIQSLIISPGNLFADDGPTREAWSKYIDRVSYTPFTALLRRALPALREIAVWVPDPDNDALEWYCQWAPREICQLLAEGVIDTAHFLYCGSLTLEQISQCCLVYQIFNALDTIQQCHSRRFSS